MAATEAKRQANRWPALLDAAAAKFAGQGYHATTIRELAAASAMTPGAVYFHVPNKQALLLAVYEEGVQRILDRVETAAAGAETAWDRLTAAVEAHLEAILDASAYARVVIRIVPDDAPDIAADLIRLRDRYEERFRALFAQVELPEGMSPGLARLFLLGALNWTPVWRRPGGAPIAEIARQMLAPLRAAGAR
ncbi:TetR family transcriptional regulator [Roseiarcus fermentans]|uniref:TetR family transcriptional regulator n=1 Tax=Roseiarcus fermentans TaxID=1473586 RepID=A0A366FU96_9HYPH|nr:TetR/AcrR family transcriptional regulator [Roseiarcus fermentans]RBP18167.1 TetR family transcriptional regulator [Roseiarcus fermentans]